MVSFGYVTSRFPFWRETFILREVEALVRAVGSTPPIFSLKPPLGLLLPEPHRRFLGTTHYPSVGAVRSGIPMLVGCPRARRCLRQVLAAYRTRPRERAKAFATLVLAAGMIPTIRRLRLRHLHAHWATMPALAAYFIKALAGIPYSVTAHSWDIYKETTMLPEKLREAEFIVTCTAANVAELRRWVPDPSRLVLSYHGLDFADVAPPMFDRGRELRILAVARLEETKGLTHLIAACRILSQRGVRVRCDIIGTGSLACTLRHLIAEYRLGHTISLLGRRSPEQVFHAYRRNTVLVVPSVIGHDGDRDGIPNVIIEAMSQGLPVVGSRLSGIPEVVQSNRTGWLVPPANALALAQALAEIHAAPQEARRRAVAAYDLVRRQFDANRNTVALLRLFVDRARAPRSTALEPSAAEEDVGECVS